MIAALVAGFALSFSAYAAAEETKPDVPDAPTVTEDTIRKPELTEQEKKKVEAELIDSLFKRLRGASDGEIAKTVEHAIWQMWLRHPSPSVEVLMGQAVSAMNAEENEKALRILGTIIEIAPDYSEAWNKRATVYFYSGEYERSLADIARVLELEPRHFGALSGLGLVHQALGNKKQALDALRRAMEIHPFLEGAIEAEKRLEEEVEGEPI
ncbi:MAG: tetratricopeptide repeat protein [Hyphomicrobiales bacterium]